MSTAPERHRSVWMDTARMPDPPPLAGDVSANVCVVGAGIAGLSTAYLLTRSGKSVVVLDDGPLAGGQTQRTTAHLSNVLDDRYVEIERLHGVEGSRRAAQSHTAAIDLIEKIVAEEQIACDFTRLDGYLFLPPGESPDLLVQEYQAAYRAGLSNVAQIPRAPLTGFDTGPCLRFPQQAQFHPLRYLDGLARAIQRDGGQIYTQTHADRIEGGSPARVTTSQGWIVTADAVVVATNTPINDLVTMHTKQAPYLTYVIGACVPRGSVPRGLYWDTADPYHYIRLQPFLPFGERDVAAAAAGTVTPVEAGEELDLLIVGGEDHKTGQAQDLEERYQRLETWARERFPMLQEVRYRWSGQVMETNDGLAFIGRNPLDRPNVFIATGDSGMGMTHGTIAGMLLTDLIHGRENPWATLYDPSRKTLRAAGEFVSENLNVALQYTSWVTGGEIDSTAEIPQTGGAVMRRGLAKVALYRDESGALHECSAVCPHLGCIVDWNDDEKTWDCPCHGSRFDRYGAVINGPANSPLAPS